MDFKKLLLTWDGRIGRQDFWIAFAILFVANLIVNLIPFIGPLIGLALIFPWVCVYAKRLHDLGYSGWVQVVPYVVSIVAVVAAMAMIVPAMMGAAGGPGDEAAMMAALGGSGGAIALFGFAVLFNIAFLVWLGAFPGKPQPNRFGPAPGQAGQVEVF